MPKLPVSNTWSEHPRRLLVALSALTFLISCGGDSARLNAAAERIGQARADNAPSPALPADCRSKTVIRPGLGERLDDLVLRYDWALGAEHARTDRCAAWYDENHGGPE